MHPKPLRQTFFPNIRWDAGYFGFEGVWDIAALPLFILVMGAYGLITMPLSNAYSRWRERRADEYALRAIGSQGHYFQPPLELTGYPWFEQMKHHLANFSLSLAEITPTYAGYLLSLAQGL